MIESKKNNWLSSYRQNIASQYGEGGVLEEIFKRIGAEDQKSWCVEFGAGDGGPDNTNTWNLINNHGWSAVLIEADAVYFRNLPLNYKDNKKVTCLNMLVNFEGSNSLDNILKKTNIPPLFDFLCVDIDGNDYHIWDSLSLYQPKVVMIEYNGRIPTDIEFIQPKDMDIRWGTSLLSLVKLGKQKSYELIYAHICNAIFVRKELYNLFNIMDNTPSRLTREEEPRTRFFQLYDGSIVLHGCERKKLLCHKKKILKHPVWVLTPNGLCPVHFYRDNKIVRVIKKFIKHSFIYPLVYPLVRTIYGKMWQRRRGRLI